MIFITIVLVSLFFAVLICIQMLIYRALVRGALRTYIEPMLKEKGFLFIDYKWPGLFSDGDFDNEIFTLTVMNINGNASTSTYAYIFYKDGNDTKKVTARIEATFWFIDKVLYSTAF
jgi:hypothetical protein